MKEWWNNFKEDLLFNIIMTLMSVTLFMLFVLLSIFCLKELITEIF